MSGGYEYILWVLLLVATVTDLLWGKVFNALTFSFLISGVILRFIQFGADTAGTGLIAVGVAFLVGFPLWQLKAFAAGDVKLLMAFGAWTNWTMVLQLGAFAVIVGSIVGSFILWRTKGVKGGLQSLAAHTKTSGEKKGIRIPFAPAFLCGFMVLQVAEMQQWRFF